jgi:nucleoside-diphosphate-sugar epimerase
MRALVTGAAGFLGSTLVEALLKAGSEVLGVDAFLENYPTSIKRANLARALGHPGFRLVEADLRTTSFEPLLTGITHVAHLAALPGVRPSWGESFRAYAEHNVIATQRLLEALRLNPVERVVVASSSSVYGLPTRFPTPEEETPRPVSPYGVTKLAKEGLLHAYWANYRLPVVSLRYFTVYGPRQRPDMGIHSFFEAAKLGTRISVFGDGEQTRDFTYVDDAVDATIAALHRPVPELIYNVGGGHRVSLNDLLTMIELTTGRAIERRRVVPPPGDPRDTAADVTRAERDLGYVPRTNLAEGLRRQWEWQRAR